MSELGQHGQWLSLLDISGPFLAEPVLKESFPQGLEAIEGGRRTLIRQAYDEWREAVDLDDPDIEKIHRAWIELVLKQALEFDHSLKSGTGIAESVRYDAAEYGVLLRPDFALVDQASNNPMLLVRTLPPGASLSEATTDDRWMSTPAERMVDLCRASAVRLGLVTNGEQWMLIDAPIGAVASFASWYARLWSQEPVTFQAFCNLLSVRRFYFDRNEQLPALFDRSLTHQDEVTDALGEQVRRAVEVLIQALDRADQDRNRDLLRGIETDELYEAGLTVMMRIVFLLSAEERGLLLLGDERYESNYAVSTLRMQLRQESEEVLERRWDAWARLLSIFRIIYSGIDHEAMSLPALGGSLFDPDRFPFLEGRAKGSRWSTDPASPLPIDNRTVLLLLEAVQIFRGRTLSYVGLDIEQIGYVYEGLLERTVVRADEVSLDLDATKNAKRPWALLSELDDSAAEGAEAVRELLKERTESSASRVRNDFERPIDDEQAGKLLTACQGDKALRDRVRPYFHLLRTDRWGYPLVYPKGTFIVTSGTERRETGTHYTPKSFTEAIVKETLEPLVYIGPSEGAPRAEWKLKSAAELLDLKICDPAMGSGAFLVQVCRWLGERLVEAWTQAENEGKAITSEGEVIDALGSREPLRNHPDERLLLAKRIIAERCVYGVDMNPFAVELAKLSIWLITLAKGRPFGFLDHNLRFGDSLLGISDLDQIRFLEMMPGPVSSKKLFATKIDQSVSDALELRINMRVRPINDIRDVEAMALLNIEAKSKLAIADVVADALMGQALASGGRVWNSTDLSIDVGEAIADDRQNISSLMETSAKDLAIDLPPGKRPRRPFHWPLEYPEVFGEGKDGFDAFVGNPPFLGSQMISGSYGPAYKDYLSRYLTFERSATADLVVFFFLRLFRLLRQGGYLGLLARRSFAEGKNREVGLDPLLAVGAKIYFAETNRPWPGKASVIVHQVHMTNAKWLGSISLNGQVVQSITSYLDSEELGTPKKLLKNAGRMFQGSILNGEGFKVAEGAAKGMLASAQKNSDVIFPFIGGHEVNTDPFYAPACWVINFWDWPEARSRKYDRAFTILEENVKPERTRKKADGSYQLRSPLPERWWHHGEKRPALYHSAGRGHPFESHPASWRASDKPKERVLVISRGVTKYPAFTFLQNSFVFSEKLYVLTDERSAIFAVLSSDVHTVWAWSQKTSMGADLYSLSYTQGNIFETFPFPENALENADRQLEELGEKFFERRQKYMERQQKGLTKFYNEFHSPNSFNEAMQDLRNLHQEINRYVCRCYGWDDVDMTCGFHEVGYLPAGSNVRFTISESTRLELLRRLSKLNKERWETAAQEVPLDASSDDQEPPALFEMVPTRKLKKPRTVKRASR